MSMTEALTILGYRDVFHAGVIWEKPEQWKFFDRAADAHFSSLPSYKGGQFSRDQWDEMYGGCEAITDEASVYVEEMIRAYPDAKVIMVQRDFEAWARSYDNSLLQVLFGIVPWISCHLMEPLLGSYVTSAMRKQTVGFMGAATVRGARDRQVMRKKYDSHHATVRRLVPSSQLLECRLGDGWAPICEFLGKPIPKVAFPHLNDSATLRVMIRERQKQFIKQALFGKILPALLGLAVILYGMRRVCVQK